MTISSGHYFAQQIVQYVARYSCNIACNICWALTSSGTIHTRPYGLKRLAKPDMASENQRKKLRRFIQLSNQSTQVHASISRSHVWLRKAVDRGEREVECFTSGWSPTYVGKTIHRLVYINCMLQRTCNIKHIVQYIA